MCLILLLLIIFQNYQGLTWLSGTAELPGVPVPLQRMLITDNSRIIPMRQKVNCTTTATTTIKDLDVCSVPAAKAGTHLT